MERDSRVMLARDIIVIGASAGGVETLCTLCEHLPKDLPAAIFIVMHIRSESGLAHVLDRCGPLSAQNAYDHEVFESGHIYVAPPDHHLQLEDGNRIRLTRGPRENNHRPAIDVLFRKTARAFQSRVVGVILSGAQDDGAAGLFAIKKRGGVAIVQDPDEATVSEMPDNALKYVEVDYCLPVVEIAPLLVRLARGEQSTKIQIDKAAKLPAKQADESTGEFVPIGCPECNGPLYETRTGELAHFACKVGHAFSPQSLHQSHVEALERALWTAVRVLNERVEMHKKMSQRRTKNKAEEELAQRFEENVATAEKDLTLLREILGRL